MATTAANSKPTKATTAAQHNIANIARATAKTRKPRSPKKTAVGFAVEQKYLDRKQAGIYIGVSKEFIVGLVAAGLLPEYDFGPFCKRYKLEDLEAYCESRRRGPATQVAKPASKTKARTAADLLA